jgi:hypothetical protein
MITNFFNKKCDSQHYAHIRFFEKVLGNFFLQSLILDIYFLSIF